MLSRRTGADGPASRAARVLDILTASGGLLCAAVGLTVMAAWLARATAVLNWAGSDPMDFNVALAMAVSGAAVAALGYRRWPWVTLAAAAFDAGLGLLVLAADVLGRDLGIDQLIVRDYLRRSHPLSSLLDINTAVCLMLIGFGLLTWAPWRPRRRPAAIAIAGSVVAGAAIVATFGYLSSTPAIDSWGNLSNMDLTTAVAMLALAVGLLCAAWRDTPLPDGGLPGWLPLPAGVIALGTAAATWLAVLGGRDNHGRVAASTASAAATVIGLLLASIVALAVRLAQRADNGRRLAQEEGARRAAAERQARASESRMFQFLDALPTAVFVASSDGQFYYTNSETARIAGAGDVPGAEMSAGDMAESLSNLYLTGTAQPYPAERLPFTLALGGQASHAEDIEYRLPDGQAMPLEIWGRPIFGTDGQVEYAICAFIDISKRIARERVIASQAALLDMAHDAVVVLGLDRTVTYWNPGAVETYGIAASDAIGRPAHELLYTQFGEPRANIEAAARRDGRWDGELAQRRADGQTIIVESRWAQHRGPDGELLGFMEVNRDITARKMAERERQRKSDEVHALNESLELQVQQRTLHLERANRDLEAFSYSVAHDLRTPLRGLSGFAEMLVEEYGGVLDETGRGYAERIQAASQRMGQLIDDVLLLSRVSRAALNPEPVDLSAEAAAIFAQLRAQDPGRQVQVTIQPGMMVAADRGLIRTVLENLLGNAWKYSGRQADAVIEFGATAEEGTAVCYFVRDNGAGFDPAYVAKLFQPFQRLHAMTDFPGTGVGLASVRQIIEKHGGQVRAEGAVGQGATFSFTLEGQLPAAALASAIPAQAGRRE